MPLSFAVGLFWLSVACCAIAQFFIVRSVRATRRGHGPAADSRVPQARDGAELMWAVLPAIGLAVLLFFTWRAVRNAPPSARTGAVVPIVARAS